jgi:type IX secretion system PorP/SprF family membrane protein
MRKIIYLLCFIGALPVQGQDLHFSQTAQTPLLINPGACGVFDGWQRGIINHRSQWMGTATPFSTTSVAADITVFSGERSKKSYLGFGGIFHTDIAGSGQFGSQNGSLTVSGVVPISTNSTLSVGIQAGMGSRKGDISQLTFGSQWSNASFAFDPSISSGEISSLNAFNYLDVGTGVYYETDLGKSSFVRHNEMKVQLGASAYHLNQPVLKFMNGTDDRLSAKYVLHAGVVADIPSSRIAIDGSIVQFIQGGHYETILGSMIRYRFSEGTKLTGYSQKAFLGFGLYMRVKDAIIPSMLIEYKGFKFGMSYDVTISKLRKAYAGGSLEFSLSYSNLFKGLFKDSK